MSDLPELSAVALVEIHDDAGWSLSVNFGRGDKARDAMRAFSDALHTGQLVERAAVEPIIHYHASGGHEGDGSDAAIARAMAALGTPPAWVAAIPGLTEALTALKGDDADGSAAK